MNKVNIMGRLTRDPEVKVTSNNVVYVRFTLAVDRRFAKEGAQQADFIPVVAWNKTAEFISMYFKKGMRVAVCGRLDVSSFNDKASGEPRTFTQVVAEDVYFADGRREGAGNSFGFDPVQPEPKVNSGSVDFSDFAGSDAFNIETEDDINFVD